METESLRINVRYDRFTDQTRVSFHASNLLARTGNQLSESKHLLSARFEFEGKTLTRPIDVMTLQIVVPDERWRGYDRDRRLRVLLNSTDRLDLGDGSHKTDEGYGGVTNEILQYQISAEILSQMATSSRVEMRIGHNEFELGNYQIRALRSLANRVTPDGFRAEEMNYLRQEEETAEKLRQNLPRLLPLIEELGNLMADFPSMTWQEINGVIDQFSADDSVVSMFRINQPLPGFIVASEEAVTEVLWYDPFFMNTSIPYSSLTAIRYQRVSESMALASFIGVVDGEEVTIGVVVDEELSESAANLIKCVERLSRLPIS